MHLDSTRHLQLDTEGRSYRYFRNAVERHWDPYAIDLETDREHLLAAEQSVEQFDAMKAGIAKFGAGEQAVTEDLAPLAVVSEDVDDECFLTTQLYEEAKHTDFFDRYWREVIHPVEEERELERSSPTDDRWFNEPYWALFDRNEEAMSRLLVEDTPENRARAYCHYHLVIEGILAQTGYYGMQTSYSGERFEELPHLPGLVEGFSKIRSDEGRHVGFGMAKLKELIGAGAVEAELVQETVDDLVPFVHGITNDERYQTDVGIPDGELEEYGAEKHLERMGQIMDAAAEIPDVDTLTALEGD